MSTSMCHFNLYTAFPRTTRVTKVIKALQNEKGEAFSSGFRAAQRHHSVKLKEERVSYKRKLQQNNTVTC